jgi:hypothetical protein
VYICRVLRFSVFRAVSGWSERAGAGSGDAKKGRGVNPDRLGQDSEGFPELSGLS